MPVDDREDLDRHLHAGNMFHAIQAGRKLVEGLDQPQRWTRIRRQFDRHVDQLVDLKVLKVALTASFSIEFVRDALVGSAYLEGIRVELYTAGFNQFRQELLDPGSELARFDPDVTILAVEPGELFAPICDRFLSIDAEQQAQAIETGVREMAQLLDSHVAQRPNRTLLVHDFLGPEFPSLGILDGQVAPGQKDRIAEANRILLQLARDRRGVYVVPYAETAAWTGIEKWFDPRMAHYAKAPISPTGLSRLAKEYLKYLRALAGKTRKVVVLDLDNTLWGGILGEDGPDGIALGPSYPGSCFVEFQQALLDLSKRGIVLAVASKNNPADVESLFGQHPHMVLGLDDFALREVGWEAKSLSLERIASTLGISPEHFVFVDDNPAECEQVRMALPQVTVIRFPERAELGLRALLQDGFFDSLSSSDEDRQRGKMYQQRARAEALKSTSGSLDDYYRALDMRMEIRLVDDQSLARAAQLTQKTNQFNLTTIRHTEASILERVRDPDWVVATCSVCDRFGDNGIVGLMMAEESGAQLIVETFLLSCRVIGRTVETGMLGWLSEEAGRRGAAQLVGLLVPTPKNAPARDLYKRHGFALGAANEQERWNLSLGGSKISIPTWLHLDVPETTR